jgi:hypothetical protein
MSLSMLWDMWNNKGEVAEGLLSAFTNPTQEVELGADWDRKAVGHNIPVDVGLLAKDIKTVVTHPKEAYEVGTGLIGGAWRHGLEKIMPQGVMDALGKVDEFVGYDSESDKAIASEAWQGLVATHGSLEKLQKYGNDHPVYLAAELSGLGFLARQVSKMVAPAVVKAMEATELGVPMETVINKYTKNLTPSGKGLLADQKFEALAVHGNPDGKKFMELDFDKIGTGMGVQKEAWGMNVSLQEETGVYFAGQVDPDLSKIYRDKLDNDYLTPLERDIWGDAELGIRPEVVKKRILEKYNPPTEFNATVQVPKATRAEIDRVMAEFEKYHDNSKAQLYGLDLHDDAIKLMINQEKPMLQQPLNVQELMKKHNAPSDMTGRQFYDKLAEEFAIEVGGEGARKMASLYLLENGIPGMEYIDDVTRSKSSIKQGLLTTEPLKYNYTLFDNSSHTMLTRQGKDIYKDALIASHNLEEGALLKHIGAEGQIPMPSLAITKANAPLDNFGEYTLLGTPSLITPSNKTKTYNADIYSGRAPYDSLKYKDPDAVFNSLDPQELQWLVGYTSRDWLTDPKVHHDYHSGNKTLASEKKIDYSTTIGQEYLRKIREKFDYLDPGALEKRLLHVEKARQAGYDPYDFENYEKMVTEVNKLHKEKHGNKVGRLINAYESVTIPEEGMLGETIRMMMNPKGYHTPTGKKRPDVPYDPKLALKKMREKKAYQPGAENMEGAGQTRAMTAREFKSLDEIKDARGNIVKGEGLFDEGFMQEFGALRQDLNKEIRDYAKLSYNDKEMVYNMIEDIIKTGEMSWFYRDKVDQSVRGEAGKKHIESLVDALKQKGKDLDTTYFESKPNRLVDLTEFKGAIVPKEIPKFVEKLLKNAGIQKILKYGSQKERKELFKKFPELMFAGLAVPTSGLLATQDDDEGKLNSGLLK